MSSGQGVFVANSDILEPLIVCGPSGVGKGTIISRFMNDYGGSDDFGFTVSHTTRKPRPGEVDGVHYHFTDQYCMTQDILKGNFLEHAEVHGNLYGTSFDSLKTVQHNLKKIPLLDIDVTGVKNIKLQQMRPHGAGVPELRAKFVFIAPPSMEILRQRLEDRGTETKESLDRRTQNASKEMVYGTTEGNFDCLIINDTIHQACQDFKKAVKSMYDL
eukprot:CAMPEP_0184866236 /NCGR_PEP_ID=MMETSP0580-20130426/21489_1 /TAXON_ID=1118495 /ORGANISM="Dactyliosolen fragilissimus" /LENGTH=215 /DNA_ID=CAMNT_0027365813 /DNA_START=213 /DNA_END=860 /DNA_ORIENTATION=-